MQKTVDLVQLHGRDSDEKIAAIKERAATKVLFESYLTYFKDQAKSDLSEFVQFHFPGHSYDHDVSNLSRKDAVKYCSNNRLSPQDTIGLMVTFSPDDTLNFTAGRLCELAFQLCKPSLATIYTAFVVEQRGETPEEMGLGPHIHILLKLNKGQQSGERARVVDRIRRKLQKYRTTSDHFLDIKFVSEKKWADKVNYCMGDKNDDKCPKLSIDRMWRDDLNLQHFYVVQDL